ncbi:MAG: TetR/AcrR family transcriptional regulator [Flavobacteriales bacterium]|nr:MAG: TetR/AcrR family transcriptional regulator [Flavobacteriales bacterium]
MGKPKDNETRQRIVAAAMKLFRTKGMSGVNMRELAENAGVNKGLLHYYFKTKEGSSARCSCNRPGCCTRRWACCCGRKAACTTRCPGWWTATSACWRRCRACPPSYCSRCSATLA